MSDKTAAELAWEKYAKAEFPSILPLDKVLDKWRFVFLAGRESRDAEVGLLGHSLKRHVDLLAERAAEVVRLRKALKNLVDACWLADQREELPGEIDGSLIDAAWQALGEQKALRPEEKAE